MTDILLNNDNGILIIGGDLAVNDSADQEVDLVTVSHAGEWRQWPQLGFGLSNWLRKQASPSTFKQRLAEQLEGDGFSEIEVRFGDPLNINAYRK